MLRPVIPLFEYVINQNYIAEFLCINKDNDNLNCNGKCYLIQKLNEQNEGKKENLPRIAMEEYPIGFVDVFALTLNKKNVLTPKNAFLYFNNYHFLYGDNYFHPPNLIA